MPKVTLTGKPADPNYTGPAPQAPDETGKCRDYWILSEDERHRGFIRPLRLAYRHDRCGVVTRMHLAIAETIAVQPAFYSHMFCSGCREHYPVAEFVWQNSVDRLGR